MNLKKQFQLGASYEAQKLFLIPLDKINVNQIYTFNVSPCEELQFFESPLRLQQCFEKVKQEFSGATILHHCNFILYPEISTKKQLIHWHGIIWFKKPQDIMQFYLYIHLLKEKFAIEMDTIMDYSWYVYCVKSRYIMEPYCNHVKIGYKWINTSGQQAKPLIKNKKF